MGYAVLHRFRRQSRRIAAAAVAVFALNWLGLALMPCAMAYAVPAAAVADHSASAAHDVPAPMPAGCPDHPRAALPAVTLPGADHAPAAKAATQACPWCVAAGNAPAGGAGTTHDRDCAVVPKPALDSRDAKSPVAPLLIALSATVLGMLPPDERARTVTPALDPLLPPDASASDRYCRRLE